MPMTNPLELTGDARRLRRTAQGRVLIVGARRDSRKLARSLGGGPWAGLPVVGFVDAGHPRYAGGIGRGRQLAVHPQTDPVPVLGGIDRLDELVDRSRPTQVVVALSGRPPKRLRPHMANLSNSEVAVHWVTEGAEGPSFPTLEAAEASRRPAWPLQWDRLGKRAIDVVASAIGLALLAPFFAVVSALILVT